MYRVSPALALAQRLCHASHDSLPPAEALPLELLARALATPCEHLNSSEPRWARLMQLAFVCRHWRAAVGLVAGNTSSQDSSLAVRCLTPLLGGWAASWTGLSLGLDKHGVPPGLQAFMHGCSALERVDVRLKGCSGVWSMQTDIEAVQHALAVIPTLRTLCCLAFAPKLFPLSLQRLAIGPAIWGGRTLEAYFLAQLQLLPHMQEISIGLELCDVLLSVNELGNLKMPSLQCLTLELEELELYEDGAFDLSWLSSRRGFHVVLELKRCADQYWLRSFFHRLLPVLQPQDHLDLPACNGMPVEAQEVLSQLKLAHLSISVSYETHVRALSKASSIELEFRLDFDEAEAIQWDPHCGIAPPVLLRHIHWDAVVSASRQLQITSGVIHVWPQLLLQLLHRQGHRDG